MKYLGIDYGSKRIGLSISDEGGSMAFPYKILQNNFELEDQIHNICGEENISAIVLGLSLDNDGGENNITGSIEAFKKNIEASLGLPVYYQKEFMTTVFAREAMLASFGFNNKDINKSKKLSKPKIEKADSHAATMILQRFLDKKNNSVN